VLQPRRRAQTPLLLSSRSGAQLSQPVTGGAFDVEISPLQPVGCDLDRPRRGLKSN
jgi:hypothetical protein